MSEVMAGMDLHCNNVVCGLVDQKGRRLAEKRLPCELERIVQWLEPYRPELKMIAVESTYNWYWLVDGLQERKFEVVLANPAKIVQYEGLKHADDTSDAFLLAELSRLGILPTGHIYDREVRPVRDLLRRRLLLVRQGTALKLSLKSLYARTKGQRLSLSRLEQLTAETVAKDFGNAAEQLIAREQLRLLGELKQSIKAIERTVLGEVKGWPTYRWLQSVPGVGTILGLTIALETGPIERFGSAGDYASYCRCVQSQRWSNGKVKGANNGKNGNKYLAWAWEEAAQYARRYYSVCRQFYDRKAAQVNGALATKALACKLSKAGWHVMRERVAFNWEKAFGGGKVESGQGAKGVKVGKKSQARAAGAEPAPPPPPPPHRPAREKGPTSLAPSGNVSSLGSPEGRRAPLTGQKGKAKTKKAQGKNTTKKKTAKSKASKKKSKMKKN